MRLTALISFFVAVSGGTVAFAQSEETTRGGGEPSPRSEATDEVVVRGQRLTNLRFEVQAARERAFHIFNEINSDDDFDVFCREEGRTGTRATRFEAARKQRD